MTVLTSLLVVATFGLFSYLHSSETLKRLSLQATRAHKRSIDLMHAPSCDKYTVVPRPQLAPGIYSRPSLYRLQSLVKSQLLNGTGVYLSIFGGGGGGGGGGFYSSKYGMYQSTLAIAIHTASALVTKSGA